MLVLEDAEPIGVRVQLHEVDAARPFVDEPLERDVCELLLVRQTGDVHDGDIVRRPSGRQEICGPLDGIRGYDNLPGARGEKYG